MPPKKRFSLEWTDFSDERITEYIQELGVEADILAGQKTDKIHWLEEHGIKSEVMLQFTLKEKKNVDTAVEKHLQKLPIEGVKNGEDMLDFLIRFEGCVELMNIPNKNWVKLLYPKLLPNGQRMIQQLGNDEKKDYKMVKMRLEDFYRITPESYREKFRKLSKHGSSYLEMIRELRTLYLRWNEINCDEYESNHIIWRMVNNNVLEQVTNTMPPELRSKFREQIRTQNLMKEPLEQLAEIADILVEEKEKTKSNSGFQRKFQSHPPTQQSANSRPKVHFVDQSTDKQELQCWNCKWKGHTADRCPKLQPADQNQKNV